MSNLIVVGEHTIDWIPKPKSRKEILWADEKPEDAYWRRLTDYPAIWFDFIPNVTKINQGATIYDQDGNLITLSEDDTKLLFRILEQEIYRRTYGVYFNNGGVLEYITGDHYFALQWMPMFGVPGDYGSYRKYQRDFFYLLRHCWMSPDRLGLFYAKPKKTGITQLMVAYYLNKSTMTAQQMMGIMSKKGDDAIDTNFMFYLHGYRGLPAIFRPAYSHLSPTEGRITFGERAFSSKKQKKANIEMLDTKVFCVPTKEGGFDAPLIHDEWLDEFPKTWSESKKDPEIIFNTNKEAVKLQTRFNGRMWLTSYPPEEDDLGLTKGNKIFFDSKLHTREYGRTKTGLICHHLPAFNSNMECFDKYGDCDEIRANELNERERNKLKKDRKAYQAAVRQYSNNEQECWGDGGTTTIFDVARLSTIKYAQEAAMRLMQRPPYQLGRLEWTNKMWEIGRKDKRPKGMFCPVEFVPMSDDELLTNEHAPFTLYQDIPVHHRNLPLKMGKDEWGNFVRPAKFNYFMGGDPVQYADPDQLSSSDEPSKNAAYIMNIHDLGANIASRKIVTKIDLIRYWDRSEFATADYENFLKLLIYTGSLALIEGNASYVVTRLKEEGFLNYMVIRTPEGTLGMWEPEMENNFKWVKMTGNEAQRDLLDSMIELEKLRQSDEQDVDYLSLSWDVEGIEQFMKFNAKDTKKFDLAMAKMYTNLCYYTNQELLSKPADISPMNMGNIAAAMNAIASASV